MAIYGYRLFTVQLRRGTTRQQMDFADCDSLHFADRLILVLDSMRDKVWVPPERIDSGDDDAVESIADSAAARRPALRVERVERRENVVLVEARYGHVSSHDLALRHPRFSADGPDVDLRNTAPAPRFRVVIAMPPSGVVGIIGTETISRASAHVTLMRALRTTAQAGVTRTAADGTVATGAWWQLAHTIKLTDPEHLLTMIRNAQASKIILKREARGPARQQDSSGYELVALHLKPRQVRRLERLVKDWAEAKNNGTPVDAATGARALAEIVGSQAETLDVDEGEVVIDQNGETKRLGPGLDDEVFTYHQPNGIRSSDRDLVGLMRDRIQAMAREELADVAWPSWQQHS
jgi:hypothetical protein